MTNLRLVDALPSLFGLLGGVVLVLTMGSFINIDAGVGILQGSSIGVVLSGMVSVIGGKLRQTNSPIQKVNLAWVVVVLDFWVFIIYQFSQLHFTF